MTSHHFLVSGRTALSSGTDTMIWIGLTDWRRSDITVSCKIFGRPTEGMMMAKFRNFPALMRRGSSTIERRGGAHEIAAVCAASVSTAIEAARPGRARFFGPCSPISTKENGSLSHDCSHADPETQMPPGSATPSIRAATLTPSPSRSSPSTTTSPRLMPTRNSMRLSAGTLLLAKAIPLNVALQKEFLPFPRKL